MSIDTLISLAGYFSCEIEDIVERPEGVTVARLFQASPDYSRVVVGQQVQPPRVLRCAMALKRMLQHSAQDLPPISAVLTCFHIAFPHLKDGYPSLFFAYQTNAANTKGEKRKLGRAFRFCFRRLVASRSNCDETEHVVDEASRLNRCSAALARVAVDMARIAVDEFTRLQERADFRRSRIELEQWARGYVW